MSNSAHMFAGLTIDPVAIKKAVYWRPVTSTTIVKVGQPVCYNSDLAADYKERTSNPVSTDDGGVAYAEGAQNYNARLLVVEEPLSANLHAFAGIVARLGRLAGADGDLIEIYVPVEGAIVPVYTDENCTINQTLLGIRNAEVDVTYPGKVIGVAVETIDRSGVDGLCWMRFNNFAWKEANSALIVDDECGSDVLLDYTKVESSQTAGGLTVRYIKGTLSGAGGFGGGMFKLRAELNAAASDTCQCLSAGFTVQASGELTDAGFTYNNSAIHAGLGVSGTPDMSGGSLSCYSATYYVTETGGAPQNAYMFFFDSGDATYADADGLLWVFHAGDIGDAALSGDVTFTTSGRKIPVKIGTTTYYIPVQPSI